MTMSKSERAELEAAQLAGAEAIDEANSVRAELEATQSLLAEARQDRDRWATRTLPDVESEAIAGCWRALEPLRSRSTSSNYRTHQEFGDPVERVLRHLAARAGVYLPTGETVTVEAVDQSGNFYHDGMDADPVEVASRQLTQAIADVAAARATSRR